MYSNLKRLFLFLKGAIRASGSSQVGLGPCLDVSLKLKFFHSLSITSTFARMHKALNIDKKNN
jgi:hypothetical protein